MKKTIFKKAWVQKVFIIEMCVLAVVVVILAISIDKHPWRGLVDQFCYGDYQDDSHYFEEFNYLDDYKEIYYDFTVTEEQALSTINDIAAWCPNILPRFMEDEGVIVLTADLKKTAWKVLHNPMLTKDIQDSTKGFFTSEYKVPIIFLKIEEHTADDIVAELIYDSADSMVISHEFAHYVDSICDYSATAELQLLYEKYGETYKDRTYAIEGYAGTNAKEFFAVLYTDYSHHFDIDYMPDEMMEYIQKVIEENSLFWHP